MDAAGNTVAALCSSENIQEKNSRSQSRGKWGQSEGAPRALQGLNICPWHLGEVWVSAPCHTSCLGMGVLAEVPVWGWPYSAQCIPLNARTSNTCSTVLLQELYHWRMSFFPLALFLCIENKMCNFLFELYGKWRFPFSAEDIPLTVLFPSGCALTKPRSHRYTVSKHCYLVLISEWGKHARTGNPHPAMVPQRDQKGVSRLDMHPYGFKARKIGEKKSYIYITFIYIYI